MSSGLTAEIIEAEKWIGGLNQTQIAIKYGVSRARVSQIKRANPRAHYTIRELSRVYFPWNTSHRMSNTRHARGVRDHLEWRMGGVADMSAQQLRDLRSWWARLRCTGTVVAFDPSFPPNEFASCGGWDYLPRVPADEDLILRVTPEMVMTAQARELFRLPPA